MPSSYTPSLRLVLPVTGELQGTWGTTVNNGLTSLVDAAIAGTATVSMPNANYTLTVANEAADESRQMFIRLTGTLSAQRDVICPSVSKLYFVTNATTGGFGINFRTSGGAGVVVPAGASMMLYCNGTDVVNAVSRLVADVTGNAATVTNGVYTTGDQTIGGIKTFTSAPVVPGINGGQLAGMRNKIINGKMEIAQRGASFAAIISGAYSLDRWTNVNTTSAVVTMSQQTDVPSNNEFQNSLRVEVTTADSSIAASDTFSVNQFIEGFNARDLIGRSFTLSFWVRSSKTGIHCVAFSSQSDRVFVTEYTVNAANTWEFKTVTVTGGLITAGTWNWTNGVGLQVRFALANGTTRQTTAGAWQTGDFYSTSNQVNCLDTIGNIFAITGVQLEVGSVATPFEHRPIGAELALCQRYFERVLLPQDHSFTFGQAFSATLVGFVLTPKVTMRAAPTYSGSNLQASNAPGAPAAIASIAATRANPGFVNLIGNTSGLTAGNTSAIAGGVGGGEYSLSAEL